MKIYLGSFVIILIATTISVSGKCPRKNQERKHQPPPIPPYLIEKCRKKGEVARWGGYEHCDERCDSPPRQMCHPARMLRCFCSNGKVRITYRGRCIPPSECPARNGQKFLSNTFHRDVPQKLKEKCRKKGEVAEWGPGEDCDETCEGKPDTCHLIEKLRCFCPKGKVRIKDNGRCIPAIQCPVRSGRKFLSNASNRGNPTSYAIPPYLFEKCRKKGEVARWGGYEHCDERCDSPPRQMCHPARMLRCFCPNGKVRITNRGRCIPPSECPERNG